MFDPKQLLDQVLGPNAAGNMRNAGRDVVDRLDATKGSKAFAGGAVAGGLLGMLLGGNYLDYFVLDADPVSGQHRGIFWVEVGVLLTVTGVMLKLFYMFAGHGRGAEDA